MTKNIDTIRQKIDELDNSIHDLLMKRTELVEDIADYKRANNLQTCVPSREAQLLRRLLDRHSGALNKASLIQIWRELIGAVTKMQADLKVTITTMDHKDRQLYWESARDYFGVALEFEQAKSSMTALNMLRDGAVDFAVVPVPSSDGEARPWWSVLSEEDNNPANILIRLPFIKSTDKEKMEHTALVLGRFDYKSSGQDNSFIFIEADSQISRGRVVETANNAGMKALSLNSCACQDSENRTCHIVEVEGFVDSESENFKIFSKGLNDKSARVFVAGGYPVMPDI